MRRSRASHAYHPHRALSVPCAIRLASGIWQGSTDQELKFRTALLKLGYAFPGQPDVLSELITVVMPMCEGQGSRG